MVQPNMRKVLRVSLRAAASILITLLLLELALRLFPSLIPPRVLVAFNKELRGKIAKRVDLPTERDTILLDRDDGGPPLRILKPGKKITLPFRDPGTVKTVVMDEMGFCNPSGDSYNKERINLVSIGDSLTWCISVDPLDTWTSRLGTLTNKSVYNLGRPGIGLYEYLQILKHFGLKKSPQTVILAVCEGNDLRDAVYYARYNYGEATKTSSGNKNLLLGSILSAHSWIKEGWIGRTSYFLNFATSSLQLSEDWLQKKIARHDSSKYEKELGADFQYTIQGKTSPDIAFNLENTDLDEPLYADRLRHKEIDLELFTPALRDFVALSKRHKFNPLIIYIPSAHTAYAQFVKFHDPRLKDLMAWFSASERRFFADKEKELGYIFYDMTDPLQKSAKDHVAPEKLLYYPTNLHLTKYGHEVIANNLAQLINNPK